MSDVLMDLNAHYKAVRARLNAGPPPKPLLLPEPVPEPVAAPPVTPPLTDLAYDAGVSIIAGSSVRS
jgi:hypothetical protein